MTCYPGISVFAVVNTVQVNVGKGDHDLIHRLFPLYAFIYARHEGLSRWLVVAKARIERADRGKRELRARALYHA